MTSPTQRRDETSAGEPDPATERKWNSSAPPVRTHSAEVLLVLADPLHLRSVQHWYVVRHGLLSVFFVPFLWDQSTKSEERARRGRFQVLGWIYLADDVLHLLSVQDIGGVDHSGVGGPVHLCILLVLGLRSRKPP